MAVKAPQLTFFTELAQPELARVYGDGEALAFLREGGHALSMGMLDFSDERAALIREFEAQGIQVTAWLLLEEADGYWLNADNAAAAMERYAALHAFGRRHGLAMARLGLDIEPPRGQLDEVLREGSAAALRRLRDRRSAQSIERAEQAYQQLVTLAHRDGREVESYQLPQMLDERRAESHLLRRTFGLLDLRVDTEVLMLYQSYLGAEGCRAYYGDAEAIALGVTGGGVYADDERIEPKVSWTELRDELLAASRQTSRLYVFSLEGCLARGMLPELRALDWNAAPKDVDAGGLRRAVWKRHVYSLLARSESLMDLLSPLE